MIISSRLHYLGWLTMKRISSILAIFLVISAVAVVAVSAGTRDDGNSTIQNDTVIVDPTLDTSTGDLSDGNNDTVQADVANETEANVPPAPSDGTTVPAPVETKVNKTVTKTNEGVRITALHPLSGGVEYVNITNENIFTAHIEGFKLKEMVCGNSFVFPDIDVKPGETLTVYTVKGVNTEESFFMGKTHHIWNAKDTAKLICSCGNETSVFER